MGAGTPVQIPLIDFSPIIMTRLKMFLPRDVGYHQRARSASRHGILYEMSVLYGSDKTVVISPCSQLWTRLNCGTLLGTKSKMP